MGKQPLQLAGRVPFSVCALKLKASLGPAIWRACLQWSVAGGIDRLAPKEFPLVFDESKENLEEFQKPCKEPFGWTVLELGPLSDRPRWMPDGFCETSITEDEADRNDQPSSVFSGFLWLLLTLISINTKHKTTKPKRKSKAILIVLMDVITEAVNFHTRLIGS